MTEILFGPSVEQRVESRGPVTIFVEDINKITAVLEGTDEVMLADFHTPGATVDFGAVSFAPEDGEVPSALEGYIHFTPNGSRSSAFNRLDFIRDTLLTAQSFRADEIVTSRLHQDDAAEMCIYADGTLLEVHIGTGEDGRMTGIVQLRTEFGPDANKSEALISMLITWGMIRHSLSNTSYGKQQGVEINLNHGPENEHAETIRRVYDTYVESRNGGSRTLPVFYLSDSDIATLADIYAPSEESINAAIQSLVASITEQSADSDYIGYIDFFTLAGSLQKLIDDQPT